jgi:hypothetical protein
MKLSAKYIWTIAIFGILAAGIGGWFWYGKKQEKVVQDQQQGDWEQESGGQTKEQKDGDDKQQENMQAKNSSSLPSISIGENIDISSWKMYADRNIEFRYPKEYEFRKFESDNQYSIGTRDRVEPCFSNDCISETGFIIRIAIVGANPEIEHENWRAKFGRDMDGLGRGGVFEEFMYNGREILRATSEGKGLVFTKVHRNIRYGIPTQDKTEIAEISMTATKQEFSRYEPILEGVVKSLRFVGE